MRVRTYEITILGNDVNILCDEELQFATLFGMRGLQCNFREDSEEYVELDRQLHVIAKAMAEVDRIIEKGEKNYDQKGI